MNGHKEMNLTLLEELDCKLDNLRSFLWLLYLAVKDDATNDIVSAVDGCLEYACIMNDVLQRCLGEQLREGKKSEI